MNTSPKLIGPAARAEQLLARATQLALKTGDPLAILIHGPPGVGKSTLAGRLVELLGVSKWSVHKYSGTQLRIELMDDLNRIIHCSDLFSDFKVIWIDEVDKMPLLAQVRFLTILDDLPPKNAVVCTCNRNLKELEERFQTRFQPFDLKGPQSHEICQLLIEKYGIPSASANHIAALCCGNVRQAELDAKNCLLLAA